jgi:hypothetical protein
VITLGTVELMDIQGTVVDAVWNLTFIGIGGSLNGWVHQSLS